MTVIGGIDLDALDIDNSDLVFPDMVPGRCLNLDGDIVAYNCAGDDETTKPEVLFNIEAEIKNLMQCTGADHYVIHITGTGSNKGKRHDISTVREYQANRNGKPKPINLEWARNQMIQKMRAVVHMEQEADDGLTQLQYEFINRGERNLCVLVSADKDLRMVPGLHLCPDTTKIVDVDGYGSCWYDKDKSKATGWGTSFFWHQLLMGDTADNIPGLPAFSKRISINYWPTAPLVETQRRIEQGTMPNGKPLTMKQADAAEAKLTSILDEYKQKPCGAVGVVKYLEDCTSDCDAMAKVSEAYYALYGDEFTYEDWRGNTITRTSKQMLYEQAILLWMRREPGHTDFMKFLKELGWEV